MQIITLFLMLFLQLPLQGTEDVENGPTTEIHPGAETPDPLALQPDWDTYFSVKGVELNERVQKTIALLNAYLNQVDETEMRKEAERRVKEISTYLEALLLLKKETVEKPEIPSLPKEAYSLEEYYAISDQIHDITLQLGNKRNEIKRYSYAANDLQQALSNSYAKYLSMSRDSKDKFLHGLSILAIGSRLLYLEGQIALTKSLIEKDNKLLSRYLNERQLVEGKLKIKINIQNLAKERAEIQRELHVFNRTFLELEAQSIKSLAKQNGKDASFLLSQELTNTAIQEGLLKSRLYRLDAEKALNTVLNHPDGFDYQKTVVPIKKFRNDMENQVHSWVESTATVMDQLSQASIKTNGGLTQGDKTSTFEENLRLALSNQAHLDTLIKKLNQIDLTLLLIEENYVQEQTIFYQISFMFGRFFQWLHELLGSGIYFSLFEIGGVPVTLVALFKASIIMLAAIWLSHILGTGLKKFAKGRGKVGAPTIYTLKRILHYIILLIATLIALASIGITTRNLAIIVGALGIGVGFGLQNIVNNFLCGLTILFERNVKIGDIVELDSGHLGKITEVNVQNTTLRTYDGMDVLVPNSRIIEQKIINWTKKDSYQRLFIPFGVAYGTDQKEVVRVIKEAALQISNTLSGIPGVPDPEVWLVELGDSSLNFELVVWIDAYKSRGRKAMSAAYLSKIEYALKENSIHIPFPQRDLHLKTLPEPMVSKLSVDDKH